LPRSLCKVDIGGFLSEDTLSVLQIDPDFSDMNISKAMFKKICDYWKEKRFKKDYGRCVCFVFSLISFEITL
jgi:hypothetical protein